MSEENAGRALACIAELFAAHRDLPEKIGRIAYARARQVVRDQSHWREVWTGLYERPKENERVIELAMAGWELAPVKLLEIQFPAEKIEAAAAAIHAEITADPLAFLESSIDEISDESVQFEDYADALLHKPGVVIGWAFFGAVILRHHLAGAHVYLTFEKAKNDDCEESWSRLLRIDPMVVNTDAFKAKLLRVAAAGESRFFTLVERAVKKHESECSWDTERRLESAMRDLLHVDGAQPLTHEQVFLLCSKYGGSAFRDQSTLRAEAAKTRKLLKLEPRSKNESK